MGVYRNPGAKGDGREQLVRDMLAERVGTSFGVTKAELIDSTGVPSPEFDAVIFDQSVAACLHVLGQRRIVRIESVAASIEVKTMLDGHAVEQTVKAVNALEAMRRVYLPNTFLRLMWKVNPQRAAEEQQAFARGFGPGESYEDLPPVINGIFAFRGPTWRRRSRTSETRPRSISCTCSTSTSSHAATRSMRIRRQGLPTRNTLRARNLSARFSPSSKAAFNGSETHEHGSSRTFGATTTRTGNRRSKRRRPTCVRGPAQRSARPLCRCCLRASALPARAPIAPPRRTGRRRQRRRGRERGPRPRCRHRRADQVEPVSLRP